MDGLQVAWFQSHKSRRDRDAPLPIGDSLPPLPPQESRAPTTLAQDWVMAACSAGMSKTATAPIERVKLVLQTQDANPLVRSGASPRYDGSLATFYRLYREQGLCTFWRGNMINILRYIPMQGSSLSFKDFLRRNQALVFGHAEPGFTLKYLGAQLVCAGTGAGLALTLCYPLDYARTKWSARIATSEKAYAGVWDLMVSTVRTSGFRGLYAGYLVAVTDQMVYRSIQFGCFDVINETVMPRAYHDSLGPLGFASAFAAATVGTLLAIPVAYPLDSIRRRLMVEADRPKEAQLYQGRIRNVVERVIREEGVQGFYKGVSVSVFRSTGSAIVPALYTKLKVWWGSG